MASEIESWPDILEAALADGDVLQRVYVLNETDSTQSAARRMGTQPGDVIVAARQIKGRGRLGRPWMDTAADGIAMTVVLAREAPERLAISSALATAQAAESSLPAQARTSRIGIKWPNDVVARERKLAGILIEQTEEHAYVGIGMNVAQRTWPAELQGIAISLAELGADTKRVDAMTAILRELQIHLKLSNDELTAAYSHRDQLTGQFATFSTGNTVVRGQVLAINPMHGLVISTPDGQELHLPAAITTVCKT